MRKVTLLIGAGVLIVGGCGGSDSSSSADSPLVEALSSEIYAESASGVSTEEEATCVAGSIVTGIGPERLEELGMTVDNVGDIEDYQFSDDEIDVIVDSLVGCVDVKAALAQEMTSQWGGEGAECVAENLNDDFIRTIMAAALRDPSAEMPDEFFQTFLDIAAECDLPMN
ncbi:MAG: hypothetical protein ACKOI2_01405 [Actinomycetota bacterium]